MPQLRGLPPVQGGRFLSRAEQGTSISAAPIGRQGVTPGTFGGMTTSLIGAGVSILFQAVGVGSQALDSAVSRHGGTVGPDYNSSSPDVWVRESIAGRADLWHMYPSDFSRFAGNETHQLTGAVAADCAHNIIVCDGILSEPKIPDAKPNAPSNAEKDVN